MMFRSAIGLSRGCSTYFRRSTRSHYSYSGPGSSPDSALVKEKLWKSRDFGQRGFTVGIGGPVGSGKTRLVLEICKLMDDICVVTNDIFTQEDADFLSRNNALPQKRIRAVETGGCPHAAIREDVSSNLSSLEDLTKAYPGSLLLCESGGDNLAAHFSSELADLTIYVIDVAGGDKVPRKGGPGITQSDLLVINKVDLAEAVGADMDRMSSDAEMMRSEAPTVLAAVKHGEGMPEILGFIMDNFVKAKEMH